jgi:hypothetical protein
MDNRIISQIKKLRDSVFVDKKILDDIEQQLSLGKISEKDALQQLRLHDPDIAKTPFILTDQDVEDEWKSLTNVIVQAEIHNQRLASSQFLLGLTALPICVILLLLSFFFGWHQASGAVTVASILGGCLAAVSAHSFFVLRIHQQASLAAERLSEKRVGILFLRIAARNKNPEDSARLLNAGTKMFLGHYVPTAIPLQAEDKSKSNKL